MQTADENPETLETLKEWGDSRTRIALIMAAPQARNPAKVVLDSADKLPEQVDSLMGVFSLLVRAGDKEAHVTFTNAALGTPTTNVAGRQQVDTPYAARAGNRDYIAPLYVTVTLVITVRKPDGTAPKIHRTVNENVHIGDVPQVVRSRNCPTSGMTAEELEQASESATDPGGYVILKGNRYAVRIMESLIYNDFTVHLRDEKKLERVQSQVISKPGDAYENSAQLVLRVMRSNEITAEISYSEFVDMHMPFYLLYRLLGVTSDEDIFRAILYDLADASQETAAIREALRLGMRVPAQSSDWYWAARQSDTAALAAYLGWRAVQAKGANVSWDRYESVATEEERRDALALTTKMVNDYFLPHVGSTPEAYPAKTLHLSYYVRSTILVMIGVKNPSDRESYAGKRLHSVDVQFAKEAKTVVNLKLARPLRQALQKALETVEPERIDIRALLAPLVPAKTAAAIGSAIQNAERKKSGQRAKASRMSTERIDFRNGYSGVVAIRTVRTPNNTSKQTERADKIRRVHNTYPGSICPLRSADSGEQVGMNKGLPILTVISRSSSSAVLQNLVVSDPALVTLAAVQEQPERVLRENLAPVMVNGRIVGYTSSPYEFRQRYVLKRRRGDIDRRATIAVEATTGETNFYVDIGRPLFPHIVVDSNGADYDAALAAQGTQGTQGKSKTFPSVRFDQWPSVRLPEIRAVLAGRASFDDFESRGMVEYLAAEEMMNCLVAPTVEDLARARHDPLRRYTHVYVHPASLLSLSTLMSPFPTHSAATRVTYQGQQAKGAQSITFTNPYDHFETSGVKQQLYVHRPLVSSLGNNLVVPGGQNAMVAVLAAGGDNLEDSCTVKRQAVERGFLSLHVYQTYEATLDHTTFGNPLQRGRAVVNVDERATYEYLGGDGIIQVGSPVRDGTALIGVLEPIADSKNAMQTHMDRSVFYRGNEVGEVVKIIDPRTSGNMKHCKVVVMFPRHAAAGDKIATFSGNKAIICKLVDEWEMEFTTDHGVTPDVVFNPLSFPSRMVMNQLVEAAQQMNCASQGRTADATAFNSGVTEQMYSELLDLARKQIHESPDPEAEAFSLFGEAVAVVEKYAVDSEDVRSRFSGLSTTTMIDPHTGARMRGITMTPLFIRRLAKFAKEDVYAVGKALVDNMSKQPAGGKRRKGGMKFGEMERDVLLAQGCMRFFAEKMFDDSSGQILHICARCNQFTGLINEEASVWTCPRCGDAADVRAVSSDWAVNILQQYASCIGVGMRVIPEPIEMPQEADAAVADGSAWDLE